MAPQLKSAWSRFKTRLRRWCDNALDHTHDHFFIFLPRRLGWTTDGFLKLFFSGLSLRPDQIEILRSLPQDAVIVYINKHKSFFEYLFFYTCLREHRLPFPQIGFDYGTVVWQPLGRIVQILLACADHLLKHRTLPNPYLSGYVGRALQEGHGGFLSLVEKQRFYKWFIKKKTDPVHYLVQLQKSMDRPIYIVPQLMFFGRRPHPAIPSIIDVLFGPEQRPGRLRRIVTLFKNPEKIFTETSDPVNLQKFLAKFENQGIPDEHLALLLRHELLVQINRQRQAITGPILKTREELKESILTSSRLQQFMAHHANKREMTLQKVRQEANGYLDEIAAKYNMGIIKLGEICIRWMTRSLFEGVTLNTPVLHQIRREAKRGPVIFIPCHKSHVDYLVLSYILWTHNMPCPHIAAGKNLSFWPLGPLFRNGGAFFIRRTFKGAVLYAKVFAEYIYKLLEEGFNIEFFIEGGRSRTGKLLRPKLGFLSIVLNALQNKACEDLIFAPIFVGYDRVVEESAYLNEIEGGKKEPESLRQVIRARRFLKRRYGRIYIQFHEPISLNDICRQMDIDFKALDPKALNSFCRTLGTRIIHAIDRVTVCTPHGLVAAALMNCSRGRFTYTQMMSRVDTYLNFLDHQGTKLSDTLLYDPLRTVEKVFDEYRQAKIVEPAAAGHESEILPETFRINTSKRPLLEYYKNNCISFFVPAAYTAAAILERDAFQFSAVELRTAFIFLSRLFRLEFVTDPDRTPEYFIRKSLKAFIDDAVLMPHPTIPETYNVTSAGFRKLHLFARFLEPFLESYWVVLSNLKHSANGSRTSKEQLKKIQTRASRMFKQREIQLRESLSKVNFQNALDFFAAEGIRSQEDAEKIEAYEAALHRYLEILQSG